MRFLFFFALLTVCCSCQRIVLPKDSKELVKKVSKNPNLNFYRGTADTVHSDGLSLFYESIGNPAHPTILLIMGFSAAGTAWPDYIIQPFLDSGFHVIRYDHREVGGSDAMQDWNTKKAYNLSTFVVDICKILDKCEKEKVHLLGMSMGGMIAQTMAIEKPERVLSLTSLSSTPYYFDPKLPTLTPKFVGKELGFILQYGRKPKKLYKQVCRRAKIEALLKGTNTVTEEEICLYTEIMCFRTKEQRWNAKNSGKHQRIAIRSSGSRVEALKKISIPTFVIHGDKDPLILPVHGRRTAELIPGAIYKEIENFGHVPDPQQYALIAALCLEFIASL